MFLLTKGLFVFFTGVGVLTYLSSRQNNKDGNVTIHGDLTVPGPTCNCKVVTECNGRNRIRGQFCGFDGFVRKICCEDDESDLLGSSKSFLPGQLSPGSREPLPSVRTPEIDYADLEKRTRNIQSSSLGNQGVNANSALFSVINFSTTRKPSDVSTTTTGKPPITGSPQIPTSTTSEVPVSTTIKATTTTATSNVEFSFDPVKKLRELFETEDEDGDEKNISSTIPPLTTTTSTTTTVKPTTTNKPADSFEDILEVLGIKQINIQGGNVMKNVNGFFDEKENSENFGVDIGVSFEKNDNQNQTDLPDVEELQKRQQPKEEGHQIEVSSGTTEKIPELSAEEDQGISVDGEIALSPLNLDALGALSLKKDLYLGITSTSTVSSTPGVSFHSPDDKNELLTTTMVNSFSSTSGISFNTEKVDIGVQSTEKVMDSSNNSNETLEESVLEKELSNTTESQVFPTTTEEDRKAETTQSPETALKDTLLQKKIDLHDENNASGVNGTSFVEDLAMSRSTTTTESQEIQEITTLASVKTNDEEMDHNLPNISSENLGIVHSTTTESQEIGRITTLNSVQERNPETNSNLTEIPSENSGIVYPTTTESQDIQEITTLASVKTNNEEMDHNLPNISTENSGIVYPTTTESQDIGKITTLNSVEERNPETNSNLTEIPSENSGIVYPTTIESQEIEKITTLKSAEERNLEVDRNETEIPSENSRFVYPTTTESQEIGKITTFNSVEQTNQEVDRNLTEIPSENSGIVYPTTTESQEINKMTTLPSIERENEPSGLLTNISSEHLEIPQPMTTVRSTEIEKLTTLGSIEEKTEEIDIRHSITNVAPDPEMSQRTTTESQEIKKLTTLKSTEEKDDTKVSSRDLEITGATSTESQETIKLTTLRNSERNPEIIHSMTTIGYSEDLEIPKQDIEIANLGGSTEINEKLETTTLPSIKTELQGDDKKKTPVENLETVKSTTLSPESKDPEISTVKKVEDTTLVITGRKVSDDTKNNEQINEDNDKNKDIEIPKMTTQTPNIELMTATEKESVQSKSRSSEVIDPEEEVKDFTENIMFSKTNLTSSQSLVKDLEDQHSDDKENDIENGGSSNKEQENNSSKPNPTTTTTENVSSSSPDVMLVTTVSSAMPKEDILTITAENVAQIAKNDTEDFLNELFSLNSHLTDNDVVDISDIQRNVTDSVSERNETTTIAPKSISPETERNIDIDNVMKETTPSGGLISVTSDYNETTTIASKSISPETERNIEIEDVVKDITPSGGLISVTSDQYEATTIASKPISSETERNIPIEDVVKEITPSGGLVSVTSDRNEATTIDSASISSETERNIGIEDVAKELTSSGGTSKHKETTTIDSKSISPETERNTAIEDVVKETTPSGELISVTSEHNEATTIASKPISRETERNIPIGDVVKEITPSGGLISATSDHYETTTIASKSISPETERNIDIEDAVKEITSSGGVISVTSDHNETTTVASKSISPETERNIDIEDALNEINPSGKLISVTSDHNETTTVASASVSPETEKNIDIEDVVKVTTPSGGLISVTSDPSVTTTVASASISSETERNIVIEDTITKETTSSGGLISVTSANVDLQMEVTTNPTNTEKDTEKSEDELTVKDTQISDNANKSSTKDSNVQDENLEMTTAKLPISNDFVDPIVNTATENTLGVSDYNDTRDEPIVTTFKYTDDKNESEISEMTTSKTYSSTFSFVKSLIMSTTTELPVRTTPGVESIESYPTINSLNDDMKTITESSLVLENTKTDNNGTSDNVIGESHGESESVLADGENIDEIGSASTNNAVNSVESSTSESPVKERGMDIEEILEHHQVSSTNISVDENNGVTESVIATSERSGDNNVTEVYLSNDGESQEKATTITSANLLKEVTSLPTIISLLSSTTESSRNEDLGKTTMKTPEEQEISTPRINLLSSAPESSRNEDLGKAEEFTTVKTPEDEEISTPTINLLSSTPESSRNEDLGKAEGFTTMKISEEQEISTPRIKLLSPTPESSRNDEFGNDVFTTMKISEEQEISTPRRINLISPTPESSRNDNPGKDEFTTMKISEDQEISTPRINLLSSTPSSSRNDDPGKDEFTTMKFSDEQEISTSRINLLTSTPESSRNDDIGKDEFTTMKFSEEQEISTSRINLLTSTSESSRNDDTGKDEFTTMKISEDQEISTPRINHLSSSPESSRSDDFEKSEFTTMKISEEQEISTPRINLLSSTPVSSRNDDIGIGKDEFTTTKTPEEQEISTPNLLPSTPQSSRNDDLGKDEFTTMKISEDQEISTPRISLLSSSPESLRKDDFGKDEFTTTKISEVQEISTPKDKYLMSSATESSRNEEKLDDSVQDEFTTMKSFENQQVSSSTAISEDDKGGITTENVVSMSERSFDDKDNQNQTTLEKETNITNEGESQEKVTTITNENTLGDTTPFFIIGNLVSSSTTTSSPKEETPDQEFTTLKSYENAQSSTTIVSVETEKNGEENSTENIISVLEKTIGEEEGNLTIIEKEMNFSRESEEKVTTVASESSLGDTTPFSSISSTNETDLRENANITTVKSTIEIENQGENDIDDDSNSRSGKAFSDENLDNLLDEFLNSTAMENNTTVQATTSFPINLNSTKEFTNETSGDIEDFIGFPTTELILEHSLDNVMSTSRSNNEFQYSAKESSTTVKENDDFNRNPTDSTDSQAVNEDFLATTVKIGMKDNDTNSEGFVESVTSISEKVFEDITQSNPVTENNLRSENRLKDFETVVNDSTIIPEHTTSVYLNDPVSKLSEENKTERSFKDNDDSELGQATTLLPSQINNFPLEIMENKTVSDILGNSDYSTTTIGLSSGVGETGSTESSNTMILDGQLGDDENSTDSTYTTERSVDKLSREESTSLKNVINSVTPNINMENSSVTETNINKNDETEVTTEITSSGTERNPEDRMDIEDFVGNEDPAKKNETESVINETTTNSGWNSEDFHPYDKEPHVHFSIESSSTTKSVERVEFHIQNETVPILLTTTENVNAIKTNDTDMNENLATTTNIPFYSEITTPGNKQNDDSPQTTIVPGTANDFQDETLEGINNSTETTTEIFFKSSQNPLNLEMTTKSKEDESVSENWELRNDTTIPSVENSSISSQTEAYNSEMTFETTLFPQTGAELNITEIFDQTEKSTENSTENISETIVDAALNDENINSIMDLKRDEETTTIRYLVSEKESLKNETTDENPTLNISVSTESVLLSTENPEISTKISLNSQSILIDEENSTMIQMNNTLKDKEFEDIDIFGTTTQRISEDIAENNYTTMVTPILTEKANSSENLMEGPLNTTQENILELLNKENITIEAGRHLNSQTENSFGSTTENGENIETTTNVILENEDENSTNTSDIVSATEYSVLLNWSTNKIENSTEFSNIEQSTEKNSSESELVLEDSTNRINFTDEDVYSTTEESSTAKANISVVKSVVSTVNRVTFSESRAETKSRTSSSSLSILDLLSPPEPLISTEKSNSSSADSNSTEETNTEFFLDDMSTPLSFVYNDTMDETEMTTTEAPEEKPVTKIIAIGTVNEIKRVSSSRSRYETRSHVSSSSQEVQNDVREHNTPKSSSIPDETTIATLEDEDTATTSSSLERTDNSFDDNFQNRATTTEIPQRGWNLEDFHPYDKEPHVHFSVESSSTSKSVERVEFHIQNETVPILLTTTENSLAAIKENDTDHSSETTTTENWNGGNDDPTETTVEPETVKNFQDEILAGFSDSGESTTELFPNKSRKPKKFETTTRSEEEFVTETWTMVDSEESTTENGPQDSFETTTGFDMESTTVNWNTEKEETSTGTMKTVQDFNLLQTTVNSVVFPEEYRTTSRNQYSVVEHTTNSIVDPNMEMEKELERNITKGVDNNIANLMEPLASTQNLVDSQQIEGTSTTASPKDNSTDSNSVGKLLETEDEEQNEIEAIIQRVRNEIKSLTAQSLVREQTKTGDNSTSKDFEDTSDELKNLITFANELEKLSKPKTEKPQLLQPVDDNNLTDNERTGKQFPTSFPSDMVVNKTDNSSLISFAVEESGSSWKSNITTINLDSPNNVTKNSTSETETKELEETTSPSFIENDETDAREKEHLNDGTEKQEIPESTENLSLGTTISPLDDPGIFETKETGTEPEMESNVPTTNSPVPIKSEEITDHALIINDSVTDSPTESNISLEEEHSTPRINTVTDDNTESTTLQDKFSLLSLLRRPVSSTISPITTEKPKLSTTISVLDILSLVSGPPSTSESTTTTTTSSPTTTVPLPEINLDIKFGPPHGRALENSFDDIQEDLKGNISKVVTQLLLTAHENFHLLPTFVECASAKTRRTKTQVLKDSTGILDTDNYPWMARIGYRETAGVTFSCSGSVISTQYILTSAHCASKYPPNLMEILLENRNSKENDDPKMKYEVEKIVLHKDYNSTTRENDIALIRVSQSFNFSAESPIRPICLPFEDAYGIWDALPKAGENAYIAGWGFAQNVTPVLAMKHATVRIWPNENCTEAYEGDKSKVITEHQICAQGSLNEDSCRGDNGASMMAIMTRQEIFFQIGVVSYGPRCGYEVPSVYTRVYSYLQWILESIER